MFGMSFIYIIFNETTDLYWARSRVLEKLSTVQSALPSGAKMQLGPDGTGVGHVFWYTRREVRSGDLRATPVGT
jgi:Cu/Ag efflux pump CusA